MRKTGKLAGLFSDLIRTKGDDALRLVSNYGDDVFRAAGMYGDNMLNFGANYTDDVLGAISRMDDVNYGARIDALSDNLLTPKSNIAVGMGNPPPVKEPLFKGDVRMNPDSSFSVLSADDVYNIENDWLTQDMLNRGELDNVGSLFEKVPTKRELSNLVWDPKYGRDYYEDARTLINPSNNPYEFLKNPAALNWGGAEGAQNLMNVEKYLHDIPYNEFGAPSNRADRETIQNLFTTLKKRDAVGPNTVRARILDELLSNLSGESVGYEAFL